MLRHHFRIFRRLLVKNPGYSLINLTGLVIAFSVTTLIVLHLRHELSYDNFHSEADDIYRIAWFGSNPQTRTPHPMAQAMKDDMPEVIEAVSLSPVYGPGLTKTTFRFKNMENNVVYDEPEGYLADTTFFDVFDFEFVAGGPESLHKIGGLLISESMAERFFGTDDPMGKFLAFGTNEDLMEVVAVLKDPPTNSHFRFNFIASYPSSKAQNPNRGWFQWGDFGHFNYIKLASGTDPDLVLNKIPEWIQNYIQASDEQIEQLLAGEIGFRLQPIRDIHLKSHIRWELDENSDMSYIYLYGLSALFILLISTINFVNISTAKSIERLKEVGVKKTLGAQKGQLLRQFFFESISIVFAALVISLVLSSLAIPQFNGLVKGQIVEGMLLEPVLLTGLVLLALVIAGLAAFYPAVYLNSINPGRILKGINPNSLGGNTARNFLLGVQFFMTVLLVSGSLLINEQIDFLSTKDLGFEKENSLIVPIKDKGSVVPQLETIKNRLQTHPGIGEVTAISNVPGGQFNYNPVFVSEAPEERVTAGELLVDYDVFDALDLELVEGRFFDKTHLGDSAGISYLLNETAVNLLNLENPVGTRLNWDDDDRMKEGTVVGVLRDFHFKSLHESISPVILQINPSDYNFLLIKTNSRDIASVVDRVQETYQHYDPINTFSYYFLDDRIADLYKEEARTLSMSTLFSTISIFLSIAGLIGVATVIVRKRIKEIGIRKVLGASVKQILWMLSQKFILIAVVSMVLSIPAAYLLIDNWLNNFTYQMTIDPLIFVLCAFGTMALILLTVSGISLKVSRSNPTSALRHE